jgi:hypothetical protein
MNLTIKKVLNNGKNLRDEKKIITFLANQGYTTPKFIWVGYTKSNLEVYDATKKGLISKMDRTEQFFGIGGKYQHHIDYISGRERSNLNKEVMCMNENISEISKRENDLFRLHDGRIPEANEDLNDLQREKIAVIYANNGKAYIGKINYHGAERKALTMDTVFTEYTGQPVYNFEAAFIVPAADNKLAEMIMQWNTENQKPTVNLINRIFSRIEKIGGANLIWS